MNKSWMFLDRVSQWMPSKLLPIVMLLGETACIHIHSAQSILDLMMLFGFCYLLISFFLCHSWSTAITTRRYWSWLLNADWSDDWPAVRFTGPYANIFCRRLLNRRLEWKRLPDSWSITVTDQKPAICYSWQAACLVTCWTCPLPFILPERNYKKSLPQTNNNDDIRWWLIKLVIIINL